MADAAEAEKLPGRCGLSKVPDRRGESLFEQVIEVFGEFDLDGNGVIDRNEFCVVMEALDSMWTEPVVNQLMRSMDTNRDGNIQYEEFLRWIFAGRATQWQADFRKSVDLDPVSIPGGVMVEVKDRDAGHTIFGPEEVLGSMTVAWLRRRIRTDSGESVGCLLRKEGSTCPLRDSVVLGAYCDTPRLELTAMKDAFSYLASECTVQLTDLGALADFDGQPCIRVGRNRRLRIGHEASEFMLTCDGRILSKGCRCMGYCNAEEEKDGSARSWTYKIAEGSYTCIDAEACLIEIVWRRRAERIGRDAGRGFPPPPEDEAFEPWDVEVVCESRSSSKTSDEPPGGQASATLSACPARIKDAELLPQTNGTASVLRLARACLAVEDEDDADANASRGSLRALGQQTMELDLGTKSVPLRSLGLSRLNRKTSLPTPSPRSRAPSEEMHGGSNRSERSPREEMLGGKRRPDACTKQDTKKCTTTTTTEVWRCHPLAGVSVPVSKEVLYELDMDTCNFSYWCHGSWVEGPYRGGLERVTSGKQD